MFSMVEMDFIRKLAKRRARQCRSRSRFLWCRYCKTKTEKMCRVYQGSCRRVTPFMWECEIVSVTTPKTEEEIKKDIARMFKVWLNKDIQL